ncbi:hypothetical protein [Metabacillus arenae]|uniref:Uncharacterized protein n=1 Tax=Metabacillus arenae TaxID=2771434 RepID=A0A926NF72_9BACI|nr:hypothetical protein [Metabacillus arenae]MBD1380439.1 hypothetical protein [Metabacillus arenae]
MNHLLTCTTEELALMVSVAGHPSIAKGIAQEALGNKSEIEWQAIMETTANQLIMKRLWDQDRDFKGESPLTMEIIQFIEKYVGSKRMIRCSNAPQHSALMLHHYEDDDWLFHLIDRDIVHEFAIISSSEMKEIIKEYYGISFEQYGGKQTFSLTDEAFDMLSDPKKVNKVLKNSMFTLQEKNSFELFIEDLKTFDWTLFNISNFSIVTLEDELYLENILFFLPSKRGIWIAEYTEDPKTPVHIYLADNKEWEEILGGIGDLAAYQVQAQ